MTLRSPVVAKYHAIMEVLGVDLDHARQNTLEAFMSRFRRELLGIDGSDFGLQNKRNLGYVLTGNVLILKGDID